MNNMKRLWITGYKAHELFYDAGIDFVKKAIEKTREQIE